MILGLLAHAAGRMDLPFVEVGRRGIAEVEISLI